MSFTQEFTPEELAEAAVEAGIRGARLRSVPTGAATPPLPADDWHNLLRYTVAKGKAPRLLKHHHNVNVVLQHHPKWKGCIQFDQHAYRVLVTGAPWDALDSPTGHSDVTAEWTDADSARLSSWLLNNMEDLEVSVDACNAAVTIAAEANACHPFRDFLDSLTWDGVERLDHYLADFFGVAPSTYSSSVGRWWLISAVARTYEPGCKADYLIVLEGEQGLKKSTALKTLTGARWFSDTPIDLANKDAYLALQGRTVVELAELESLKKISSDSRAKTFFSSNSDDYRPPYGKRMVRVPRGCVFAGTIDHWVYLTDKAGGRRYWPVRCTSIDLVGLAAMRDQLWAEAVTRYKAGPRCAECATARCSLHRWWPDTPEEHAMCRAHQDERREVEIWTEAIHLWLTRNPGEVTMAELLKGACGVETKDQTRSQQMRASEVLDGLGYERVQVRGEGGRRPWVYRRGP